MKIVLDASAALPGQLPGPDSGKVERILGQAEAVIAPELFIAELGNALWKYVHFRDLDRTAASHMIQASLDLVDSFFGHEELIAPAIEIAIQHNITVYDSIYLALCQFSGYKLLTLDKKLDVSAKKLGLNVKWSRH